MFGGYNYKNPYKRPGSYQSFGDLFKPGDGSSLFGNADIPNIFDKSQKSNEIKGNQEFNQLFKNQQNAGRIFGVDPQKKFELKQENIGKNSVPIVQIDPSTDAGKASVEDYHVCAICSKRINQKDTQFFGDGMKQSARDLPLQMQLFELQQKVAKSEQQWILKHENLAVQNDKLKAQNWIYQHTIQTLQSQKNKQEQKGIPHHNKKEYRVLFKEKNMKKWFHFQEYSQKLTLFVEEIGAQIPEKRKNMMKIVDEGETKILKSIEDNIMIEIPEKIHQNLEQFRISRQTELKISESTSQSFREYISKEKEKLDQSGTTTLFGETFENMSLLLKQSTTAKIEEDLGKIKEIETRLSRLKDFPPLE